VILTLCTVYVITNQLWALILWETVAIGYMAIGFIVAWRHDRTERTDADEARAVVRWMWIPPVLAAIVGANSAISALVARNDGTHDNAALVLVLAASIGIFLSWILLQLGFANAYQVITAASDRQVLRFPEDATPTTLDYLYFSFSIGTSFATSDVEIVGFRARRVALVHSIVAFFYNALVVAVAFQILQGLITS
jgi:uncharacterized membrane protein